jgi:hypothetical protein
MVTYSLLFVTKNILIVTETIWINMAEVVKIPTPVYERMSDEAKKSDVSRGTIVREWMQKADAYDSALFKNNVKTDGDE